MQWKFARPARIPFKSGAATNELDGDDDKKYKDEWQFAEVMNFFTPPALKKHEKLILAGGNPSTSQENDGESEAGLQGETSAMGSFETEDASVYVSQINTKIFLNGNKRYHNNPCFPKFPERYCGIKAKGHGSGKFCSHGQQLLKLFEFEDSHSARTEATAQTFHHVGSFRQDDCQVG